MADGMTIVESVPPAFYARQSAATDPGRHVALFARMPNDVGGICRIAQNVILHVAWARVYGVTVTDARRREQDLQTVGQRLDYIVRVDGRALDAPREPGARTLGACRDLAALVCSVLRSRGTPARVRCGFASYLVPRRWENHWICEYWDAEQTRWRRADAQLDDVIGQRLRISFDPCDVPPDRFITGREAWRRYRAGMVDALDCGDGATKGSWLLMINLVRDVLALQLEEVSPWDTWRDVPEDLRIIQPDVASRADRLAAPEEPVETNVSFDEALHVPPWLPPSR